MDLKEIENWCNDNGYALIDLKRNEIDPEIVFRLAKESCFIHGDLFRKTRQQELTFARNLAVYYLSDRYTVSKLAQIFKRDHSTIIHAKNLMSDDIRFFKDWQQKAIKHFDEKVNEIEALK